MHLTAIHQVQTASTIDDAGVQLQAWQNLLRLDKGDEIIPARITDKSA